MTGHNSLMSIDKLTGRENWASWSFAVKAYLQHEDLYNCVLKEPDVTDPNSIKQDTKAKSKLILLVDPILYVHIQEAQNAKQVWDNLAKAFEDSGLTRKVGLLKELINTNLENSLSVEDYVNKIMTAAHKLRNIKFNVDDEWLGTLMLAGLPEMYRPMIMGLESSGMKISADLVKNKLLQEVKTSDTTALYTNTKKYQPKSDQLKNSKGPRCFNCNKHGHLSKNCWHKNNKKTEKKETGYVAAFSASTANYTNSWHVDSGASMHMTMHRDWLTDITPSSVPSIKIANNKVLKVECCGNVCIKVNAKDGSTDSIQVRNVLYVPELKTNLLSVSKIIKSGCRVTFNEYGCEVYNPSNKLVAKAELVNETYLLNTCKNQEMPVMMAKTDDDTYLWHQRMGHLNMPDLMKIPNCTTGVKLSPLKEDITCISCIEGKQTRQSFPTEGSRATELLEVIHSDLCGPIQTASLGGAKYFVTFIDDFSRKVFVYPIKYKSETLEKFKEFKNRVENELNKKIKKIRTDNGKEYMNKNYEMFLKQCGILHQHSNPYTPQQNGLSERMNRTLIERSKCMILNAELQNNYWAEAVVTAAHIINRSPTRSLSYITPEEVWTGKKPDLSHIKVFGCKAMVHIPKERRQKLDPKSRELLFVGYSDGVKGYRFIDPKSKQAITSRDVVFLEATINRNMMKHQSSPEKEKIINNMNKIENKQECIHENNDKNRGFYLPLFTEDNVNEEIQICDDNDTEESHPTQRSLSPSSSSYYSDPNDETYVPDVSSENHDITDSSFFCMNGESAMVMLDKDPQSVNEAFESANAEKWKKAMKDEYESLLLNDTWTLVKLPQSKKVIPCKWVFKTKSDENGNIIRYKARLVVKGYQQKKGIDYHEIYAPVVRYSSLRYIFGLAAKHSLKIHQMDAVTAFLQGDIEEDIYIMQPPHFEESDQVCKLNKSIYGLKQASRQWNKKLNSILLEIGMTRSKIDPCIYYRIINEQDIFFITVYVDDILCFFNNEQTALIIKKKLNENFHMKDLGEAKRCIGFRITRKENEISLDQSLYIEKILTRFNMSDCKPIYTPSEANLQLKKAENEDEVLVNIPYQEVIGCLLYLSQGTRCDLTYIVNQLSRFNNKPTAQHWTAAKRVLRYLKGTQNAKLTFRRNCANIIGYCDADWATDTEDRRSCSGYIFLFQGAAISWCSKRQPTIALSSTESEFMSLATAVQEAIWLKQLEEDFWPSLSGAPILMYCDNQSAIRISGNDIYHARSKHIDVRYHFVRERVANNQVAIRYKKTEDMVADALTKGLHRPKHEAFTKAMGLRSEEGVEMYY